MSLKDLVDISRRYGKDPKYVLAGGGNTSLKDEKLLYIKASGTTLAETSEEGLVRMRRERLDAIWQKRYSADPKVREQQALADLMDARAEGETKRPSVETLLHELLRQRYVVHTHPALVNGLTCGHNGREAAAALFGAEVLWIPTTNPGYVLASSIRRTISEQLASGGVYPSVLILQNHGIFVAAEQTDEIVATYDEVFARLGEHVARRPEVGEIASPDGLGAASLEQAAAEALRDVAGENGERLCGHLWNGEIERRTASRPDFAELASFGYTPDHIVYCKTDPAWVPFAARPAEQGRALRGEVERYRQRLGVPPRIIAVERRGVVVCGENRAEYENARALFLDLLQLVSYAESFGGPALLPPDQIEFIRTWEVESYRAKVSGGGE